jgi:hypothetical protein
LARCAQVMLKLIRLLHTIVWALFAGTIIALPVLAWAGRFDWALGLTSLVTVECMVLVANRWRCPLTSIAAKYTADRRDNFDICLPAWLARYNKQLFGALFAAAELLVIWRWLAGGLPVRSSMGS